MVVPGFEDSKPTSVSGDIVSVTDDLANGACRRRNLVPIAAVLIVVVMAVGWMFDGFSLVRLALPDTAVAPPDRPAVALNSVASGQQLNAWLAELEAPLDALLVQRDNMSIAASTADMAGIQRACEAGRATLPRLQKLLPSPEPALTIALQQVIDDYRFGFTYCLTGILHEDTSAIELAAVYLHRANNDLRTMMAIIARDLAASESNDSDVVQI